MSTVPGAAALCSLAATFVVSPIAVYSVLISSPTAASTASPVLIPTRTPKSTPKSRLTASAYSFAAAWISKPARTARSASSSCATGAPKNARIASPSNLATVPPYFVTDALRKTNAPFMISATCSGSSRSPSPVESTTSANSTVTYLRSPSTRAGASNWLPQFRQNLAPSGLAVWQRGQFISTPNSEWGKYCYPDDNYPHKPIQPVAHRRDTRSVTVPYSGTLLRYWWTNCTAIEPSPTADATRLTDRWRTSPAAKMPGTLVSRKKGSRSRCHPFGRRPPRTRLRPVRMKPCGSLATASITQSVCGLAPIKIKRANAGTVCVSPVVASAMMISSSLVSPLTSATVERVSIVIFSCDSICETRYWDMLLASD